MPDVLTDRRGAARYPLILVAEITEVVSGAKISARSSDLSRSGCYIDSLNPIPAGSTVRVRLVHHGESLEINAHVVYVSPGLGMGIAFNEPIPAVTLVTLDRWLNESARAKRR
jgi:PilZ domain